MAQPTQAKHCHVPGRNSTAPHTTPLCPAASSSPQSKHTGACTPRNKRRKLGAAELLSADGVDPAPVPPAKQWRAKQQQLRTTDGQQAACATGASIEERDSRTRHGAA